MLIKSGYLKWQVYGTIKCTNGESRSMGRSIGRVLSGEGDGGGQDYTAMTFTSNRYQKRHLHLGEERKSTSVGEHALELRKSLLHQCALDFQTPLCTVGSKVTSIQWLNHHLSMSTAVHISDEAPKISVPRCHWVLIFAIEIQRPSQRPRHCFWVSWTVIIRHISTTFWCRSYSIPARCHWFSSGNLSAIMYHMEVMYSCDLQQWGYTLQWTPKNWQITGAHCSNTASHQTSLE